MNDTLTWLALLAAGIAAAGYIFGRLRRGFKAFEVLSDLVAHELTPNSGGSLHDKITRIDKSLGDHLEVAQRDHDDLQLVKQHLGLG